MAATDVGDDGSRLQLGLHAFERGNPLGDEMHIVAGPEEALGALE
jgi:hypothetical protein